MPGGQPDIIKIDYTLETILITTKNSDPNFGKSLLYNVLQGLIPNFE
jgi:hypothetical protein